MTTNRRKPSTTITVRLSRKEQIQQLIKDLRAAQKLSLHRGGNVHVFARDYHNDSIKACLLVNLTYEAMGRHC